MKFYHNLHIKRAKVNLNIRRRSRKIRRNQTLNKKFIKSPSRT